MPGFILHVGATVQCPHGGGLADIIPGSPRVKVSQRPVATASDAFPIRTGCPFTAPGPKPQPCVRVQWVVTSARVRVGGQPVILKDSTGICFSADSIPQGPPAAPASQRRVRAT